MRKDNYLIALINKGVLRLAPPPLAPTLTVASRGIAGRAVDGQECELHGSLPMSFQHITWLCRVPLEESCLGIQYVLSRVEGGVV